MHNKKRFPQFLYLLALLLSISFFTGCERPLAESVNQGYSRESFYFDTICNITIFGVDESFLNGNEESDYQTAADAMINEAFVLCSEYEKLLSKTVEGSDIDRINSSKGLPVCVDPETIYLLKVAKQFGDLTNGSFDITVGAASRLWKFNDTLNDDRQVESIPGNAQLSDAVSHIDYRKIHIDETKNQVTLEDPEMMIDLGGIAKGYIADQITLKLEELGARSAIVNLGGNVEVIGGKSSAFRVNDNTNETDFTLGVYDPRENGNGVLTSIKARNKTMVSSGTYERYVLYKGVKYHHILDPSTGLPVNTQLLQVTITGEKGTSMISDILSTTCLLLGEEKGNELIKQINESKEYGHFEAIYLYEDSEP